jgi:hypothetical protein
MAQPEGFMTALGGGMVQMHEMFRAMRTAGFSEKQALELTKEMLRTALLQGAEECPHCGMKPSDPVT